LLLALKGNGVVAEWVKSPIAYEEESGFRSRLSLLLDEIMVPQKVALHYVGLLRKQWETYEDGPIRLKKLLYAVRPAIALEWLRSNDFQKLPPMNMMECLSTISVDEALRKAIHDLVAVKSQTREMGEAMPPERIQAFLAASIERYADLAERIKPDQEADSRAHHRADIFYQQEVQRTIG
jgi:predicted nucleotidyltransferase